MGFRLILTAKPANIAREAPTVPNNGISGTTNTFSGGSKSEFFSGFVLVDPGDGEGEGVRVGFGDGLVVEEVKSLAEDEADRFQLKFSIEPRRATKRISRSSASSAFLLDTFFFDIYAHVRFTTSRLINWHSNRRYISKYEKRLKLEIEKGRLWHFLYEF